ncbi:EAL domain-containing protein [Gluconacetobacter azotocaptans]|uniref:EAL domain-containing protein n=1 Tax=Gluconacetobacter azotocaptans TaxID=142834 RepID=A0A7W4PF29_9PROT|nr:EAL domain-containing protein [Gluconacetobacter azotocaptans]MBB2191967.1 EAL domain-containing protein [Gluconacetobacter azotocaptans]GBQ29433.1 GGDEF family signaling protein [Gluconacetobacter azotocaptans DSM 13594]
MSDTPSFDRPSPAVSVLHAMAGGVIVVDTAGTIVFVNDTAARLAGWGPKDWPDRAIQSLLPGVDMTPDGRAREVRLARRSGGDLWLELIVTQVADMVMGAALVVTLRDMTGDVRGRERTRRLANIVRRTDRGVMILDGMDRITYVNPAFTRILGYDRHEVANRDISMILSGREVDMAALREFRDNLRGRRGFDCDLHAVSRSGKEIWLCTSVTPVSEDEAGDMGAGETIVIMSDETPAMELRTLRHDVMAALTGALEFTDVMELICQRIEAIAPDVAASIILAHDDGTAWMAGRASLPKAMADAVDGLPLGPMTGSCGATIHSGLEILTTDIDADPRWTPALRALVRPSGLMACWAVPIRLRDGTVAGSLELYFRAKREPALWHRRVVDACLQLCSLAVEQERARVRIAQLAHYDAVTGLPNRVWLREHLQTRAVRPGWCGLTLMSVDIDRFRTIGDALGQAAADEIVIGMAQRLKSVLGPGDLLTRAGQDEFIIVTGCGLTPGNRDCCIEGEGYLAVDRASVLAGALLRVTSTPFVIRDMPITSTASIGICAGRDKGHTVDLVLRHVQLAVSQARDAGGNCYRFFSAEMNRQAQDRVILSSALGDALAAGRLTLAYQPQVEPRTGRLHGVEALARWHDPVRGDISPARFIPLAEESGLIDTLGEWALRTACHQMAAWMDAGVDIPTVSVNLSAQHFRDPGLPDVIAGILAESAVPAHRLTVEITESMMIEDQERTMAAARAIRALGVGLSMDDFGTGFSNLANLASLPLSEVKIDRSFLIGLKRTGDVHSVLAAVVRIGRSLGLTVVAEGVETKRQLELLDDLDCPVVQGFLMSRPLPAELVSSWLQDWQQSHRAPAVNDSSAVPLRAMP